MKKFIFGFVVGALLFGSVSAFAASGIIGEKVQGLLNVEKKGNKIADAVVVNGIAYAPVRALSESLGADLKVEGKKIVLDTTRIEIETRVSFLNESIGTENNYIMQLKEKLIETEAKLAASTSQGEKDDIGYWVDIFYDRIAMAQISINDLQAQIDRLQK